MTITIGNEQIISLTRRSGRSKGVAPISEPSAQSRFVGMSTITAGSRSRVPAIREAGHVAVKVEEIDAQLKRTYTALSKGADCTAVVHTYGDSTLHDKSVCRCPRSKGLRESARVDHSRSSGDGRFSHSDGPDRIRRGSCDGQTPRGCWGMLKPGWCRDIARTDAAGPSCPQTFVSECV